MRGYIQRFLLIYKEYIVLIFLLLVSLIIISYNQSGKINSIKSLALGGFSVFAGAVDNTVNLFRPDEELLRQKEINAELNLRLNLLERARKENAELKELLGVKDSSSYPLFPARIISKNVKNYNSEFILNTGSNNGIEKGMPVINEYGLVGIVSQVSENYSSVHTLHNTKFRVAAENSTGTINGIAVWNGNKVVIRNLPADSDIKLNDEIVTSDFSTIMPPEIKIGYIKSIETTVSGLLTSIEIKPYVNYNTIKNVFVLGVIPDKEIDGLKLNMYR